MGFWSGVLRSEDERRYLMAAGPGDGPALPHPLVASLMLTWRCQLHCGYCPFQAKGAVAEDQPTERWVQVVRRLAVLGVRRVSFSGGEPTLHPGLARLVRAASESGCVPTLVTNGLLLDRQLDPLQHAGLAAITVSLDAVRPEAWSRARGGLPKQHRLIVDAVLRARDRATFWIGLNVVLSSENLTALPDLLAFAREHCLAVQVQPANALVGSHDRRPDPQALAQAVGILLSERAPQGPVDNSTGYLQGLLEFREYDRLPQALSCHIPDVEFVIDPDLGVRPCCAADAVGHALHDDLEEIWNGPGYGRWRTLARSRACKGCMLLYHEATQSPKAPPPPSDPQERMP